MEITKKQHDDIMQHLRRIIGTKEKPNNLTRDQWACIYHIMFTMVDILEPSRRELIKKALAECK
jgi:predicted transcriptional regulator